MNSKSVTVGIGILLILFGLGTFIYRGVGYTTQEKVVEIGPIEVSHEKNNYFYINPWISGLSLAAGLILVVAANRNKG